MDIDGLRPRVMFVDDEPDVLAGLRTSLRRDRKQFDFEFAEGAAQALERLSEGGADIVVSDMRMPGMNGVEFLSEVAVRHPEAVRIVLSGEPGSDLVIRAMAVCHQWLSKPCDRDTVVASLEASVRFRRLMADPTLRAAVCQADPLPTAPRMYQKLKALATSPDVSATQIADLASSDAALAAKVLQLANSAFVGRTPVMTIRDAIVRVGVEHLVLLVLSTELLREWDAERDIAGLSFESIVNLGRHVAGLAADLSPAETAPMAGVAGLIHQIGLLLQAKVMPDDLDAAYEFALENEIHLVAAQRQLFGVAHPDLAGHLLSVWGLPTELVLAVAESHHAPDADAAPVGLRDAVRIAVRTGPDAFEPDVIGTPHRLGDWADTGLAARVMS